MALNHDKLILFKKQENEATLNKSRLEELKRHHSQMNSEDVDDGVGDHTIWKYESWRQMIENNGISKFPKLDSTRL